MITKFEINEKQETQIKEWQDAVNKVYEEYGSFGNSRANWTFCISAGT